MKYYKALYLGEHRVVKNMRTGQTVDDEYLPNKVTAVNKALQLDEKYLLLLLSLKTNK